MRALITGAGAPGGIGIACARALGAAGYGLTVACTTGRIHGRAAELAAEGFDVTAHQADLTDPVAVARLWTAVGAVAVLVNDAGAESAPAPAGPRGVSGHDPAGLQRALDAALTAAVLVTRAFLPAMVAHGQGRVIMLAPDATDYAANPGKGVSAAGRAALAGLTQALAREVASRGVTVNTVVPGWIIPDTAAPAPSLAGRAGTPGDVAAVVAFVASPAASYVNGATIIVDGGNSLSGTGS